MAVAGEKEHLDLKDRILKDPGFRIATFGVSLKNVAMTKFGEFDKGKIAVNFDNDPKTWGKPDCWGTMTLSPSEAGQCTLPIVIFTSSLYQVGRQLDEMGIEKYYWAFYFNEKLNAVPRWRQAIDDNRSRIEEVKSLLADRRSLDVYDSVLEARRTESMREWRELFTFAFTEDHYFPRDVPLELTESESFVDAGAYIGDTVEAFIARTGGRYSHIYAFEPDVENFAKLKASYGGKERITLFNRGLYSEDGVLAFLKNRGDGSRFVIVPEDELAKLSEEDGVARVCSIDSAIKEPVTYIKMDIESFEPYALEGASGTIKRQRPKLAISLYHDIDQLWSIPLMIRRLNPDYKLYIRHHSLHYNETVLYAV